MYLAVLMTNEDFVAGGYVPIKAVEVVDNTVYLPQSSSIQFSDPVTQTIYVKKVVQVAENSYKASILSNYSECVYDTVTGTLIPQYTVPDNRNLSSYDRRFPLAMDNP